MAGARRLVLRAHSFRWNTCTRWEEMPAVNRSGLTACVDCERASSNRHNACVRSVTPVCDARLSAPSFLPTLTSEARMTRHLQSEQNETGVSRRGLVQVLAAGAAASIATPASAQQTSAQQQGAVLAEAASADYARD